MKKVSKADIIDFMKRHRIVFIRLVDIFILIIAYAFVELFKTETLEIFTSNRQMFINTIFLATFVYQLFLTLFDCYKNIIKYENGKDYLIYGFGCMVACVIVSMLGSIFKIEIIGPRSNLLAGVLISVMMITYRLIIRLIYTDNIVHNAQIINVSYRKNLLIIGGRSCNKRSY